MAKKLIYQAAPNMVAGEHEKVYVLATQPPANWRQLLGLGLGVVAALLLGSGLIFWIAANWGEQTRGFKLVLIQCAFVASALAALLLPKARHAALLAMSLSLGGWLAFIGQSYQTGADAWQLFAVWAGLSLLWTWPQRSDLLWSLWLFVAALALALWSGHGLLDGFAASQAWGTHAFHLSLWALMPLVPVLVNANALTRHRAGLMRGAWRLAMTLSLAVWCGHAVWGWFDDRPAVALVALLWILLATLLAWRSPWRDWLVLAVAALALNVAVLSGVARWVFDDWRNVTGGLLVMSLVSLAAMGATGKWLLREQAQWEFP